MLSLLHATVTRTGSVHDQENEDHYASVVDAFPGPAFAVFDGHGGAAASSYLSEPDHLIGLVATELRDTIGDDLVTAMTNICRNFKADETKHTQLTTEIEQEQARLATLDEFKDRVQVDETQTRELDSLEDQVRGLVSDLQKCVGHIDQQESERESFMRQFWGFVDQSFPNVVTRAFLQADRKLLETISPLSDGSTATVVWLVGHDPDVGITLYCANVGDSRAVLCRDGHAVALSHDQRPSDRGERHRIVRQGGVVGSVPGSSVERVYSPAADQSVPMGTPVKCLAMARSFGDRPLKQPVECITAEPELKTEKLGPGDVLVVIASDGVWTILTNQEAVDIALAHFGDADAAARAIVWEAHQRGGKDDATVTVVQFGWMEARAKEIQARAHELQQQRDAQQAQEFAIGARFA